MKNYSETSRELPVYADVDVVVVGGGIAGCSAAIAAARAGAKVVLVEQYAILGGNLTNGGHSEVNNSYSVEEEKYLQGLPTEILEQLTKRGGVVFNAKDSNSNNANVNRFLVDPEIVNIVLMDECINAKVGLNMLTVFCDTLVENNTIKGIVVQNKAGRYAIMGKVVIDATGNSKLAVASGVNYSDAGEDKRTLGDGLAARIGNVDIDKFMAHYLSTEQNQEKKAAYKKVFEEEDRFMNIGKDFFGDILDKAKANNEIDTIKVPNTDVAIDFADLSGAKWRNGEVLANILVSGGLGIDQNSEYAMDIVLYARKYALQVSRVLKKYVPGFEKSYLISTGNKIYQSRARFVDTAQKYAKEDFKNNQKYEDALYVANTDAGLKQVPLRVIVPEKINNLLTLGNGLALLSKLNETPYLIALGQGAGVVAAVAVKDNVLVKDVNTSELKAKLKEQKVLVDVE